jgi:hypothetical protein
MRSAAVRRLFFRDHRLTDTIARNTIERMTGHRNIAMAIVVGSRCSNM